MDGAALVFSPIGYLGWGGSSLFVGRLGGVPFSVPFSHSNRRSDIKGLCCIQQLGPP